jgi:hypothetical protein
MELWDNPNWKQVKFDHDMEKASMAIAPGSGLNAQYLSSSFILFV